MRSVRMISEQCWEQSLDALALEHQKEASITLVDFEVISRKMIELTKFTKFNLEVKCYSINVKWEEP